MRELGSQELERLQDDDRDYEDEDPRQPDRSIAVVLDNQVYAETNGSESQKGFHASIPVSEGRGDSVRFVASEGRSCTVRYLDCS